MSTPVLSSTQNNYPAQGAVAVVPSDVANSGTFRALWVGTAGNITIVTLAGTTVLFSNVPAGIFPVAGRGVKSTGTSAALLVALT